ncbi:hypothetical protein [Alicyclobacillus herbarius]|uniref:hypothetical protein n=1 Tax=Alicyclobacillus herbarius TaxID=122960 RepID=UPI0003FF17B7|nr:hypothetical protein [Alicyclobacillus herbarius]
MYNLIEHFLQAVLAAIAGFTHDWGLAIVLLTAAVALYYVTSGLWSAGERGLLGRLYKPVVTAA